MGIRALPLAIDTVSLPRAAEGGAISVHVFALPVPLPSHPISLVILPSLVHKLARAVHETIAHEAAVLHSALSGLIVATN